MKLAPLLLALFMLLSIGGAQETSEIEKAPNPVSEKYLKTDVSLMEVDLSDGTLYLTIKDQRLAYIPSASVKKWSPGVLPTLSTDRHARVMECLAIQSSIANAQEISITRFTRNNKIITSLSVFTVPK